MESLTSNKFSPLDLFPPELWELIFDKVESPQDLLNVCKASPEFDGILYSSKTSWLFEMVFPFIFHQTNMDKAELLLTRLICKKWRHSIDDYLATHPRLHSYSKGDHNVTMKPNSIAVVRPTNFRGAICKRLTSFTKYMDADRTPASNPFVGRTVCLQANWGVGRQEYWNSALNLFQKVGHHVWHIEANYDHAERTPLDFYLAIQKLLKHLPNLRSLSICGAHYWSTGEERQNEVQAFRRSANENPLPTLTKLVSLKMVLDGMPSYFYDPLIKIYGKHIEKLVINKWKNKYGSQLHNLADLDIGSVDIPEYCTKDVIKHLKAPEKLLRLVPGVPGRGAKDVMGLYLQMLQPCTNIETLQIRFWSSEWMGTSNSKAPVVLKSLKYLSLLHHENCSYEFLKQMPSLEHLCLQKVMNESRKNVNSLESLIALEIRKLMNFSMRPKETSLWKSLPSLKVLTATNGLNYFKGNRVRVYTPKE